MYISRERARLALRLLDYPGVARGSNGRVGQGTSRTERADVVSVPREIRCGSVFAQTTDRIAGAAISRDVAARGNRPSDWRGRKNPVSRSPLSVDPSMTNVLSRNDIDDVSADVSAWSPMRSRFFATRIHSKAGNTTLEFPSISKQLSKI